MIIISALSKNRVIGSGDGMLWDVPDEYQHFLDTIRNQTLIIGQYDLDDSRVAGRPAWRVGCVPAAKPATYVCKQCTTPLGVASK